MENQEEKTFQEDKWDGTIATSFEGGSGTQDNPYLIATGAQLAYLSKIVNSSIKQEEARQGAYYKLTADINLSRLKWTPIGSGTPKGENGFCGAFDGDRHKVFNLKVYNVTIKTGLFGLVTSPEKLPYSIRNLLIEDANIIGGDYTSILAGYVCGLGSGSAKIQNCHVNGTLTGKQNSGGISGYISYTSLEDCSAHVIATCPNDGIAGALVGETFKASLVRCKAEGKVHAKYTVGGLAGMLFWETTVNDCRSVAHVTTNGCCCGGFAGTIAGYSGLFGSTVSNCMACGTVTSFFAKGEYTKIGGFVGELNASHCINCKFSGAIVNNGDKPVGAFIGYDDDGKTSQCQYEEMTNESQPAIGVTSKAGTHQIN